jgi:glyoxylase-like metal-dependent hydrolase (beta-lactamase superfamily II)
VTSDQKLIKNQEPEARNLKLHVLDTGYTTAIEGAIIKGGRLRKVVCHSLVGLLLHPEHGPILFDTGYAPRIMAASRRFPYKLYRWVTPLHVTPEGAVAAQLPRFGLTPDDIRYVILSHFHADHVAGLRDFPRARLVAKSSGYEYVSRRRGWRAVLKGFLPALMPPDFRSRAMLLPDFAGHALPGLGPTHALFGDLSLQLVDLPGHARGQIGLLVATGSGRVLLAADGCWMLKQVRERRPPHPITGIIADDMAAVRSTIDNLHAFAEACPDVRIIPCHCPEAYAREVEPA